MSTHQLLGALLAAAFALAPARADTVQARCELSTLAGVLTRTLPCSFSQRQGYIGIALPDGTRHELSPLPAPTRYRDAQGRTVQRSVLGKQGQAFRLSASETLSVFWDRTGLPGVAFDRTLQRAGIGFRVESSNAAAGNSVRITASGLALDNAPVERAVEGHVADAQVGDIDGDGSPEIYVVVRRAPDADRATLLALSANRRKSLSDMVLPELTEHPTAAQGYRGHDRFTVQARTLLRRFPLYAAGDADDRPSRGQRELRYRLVRGEATWRLRLERVVDRPAGASPAAR